MANNFPSTYPPVTWTETSDNQIFNYPPFNQYYGSDTDAITPYFEFNQATMTDGQIYYDVAFQIWISQQLKPAPPTTTGATTGPAVDYTGPLSWLFTYLYYELTSISSFTNYPIPLIYQTNPQFFQQTPLNNYGLIGHVFEPTLSANGTIIFSVVNCHTGVECYRMASSQSLATVSKVVNGSISADALTYYDYFILMNILQVDITDYPPYQTFVTAQATPCTGNAAECNQTTTNNLGVLYDATTSIEWDWVYVGISKNKPRVVALMNSTPNYLLGLSWLPWNNYKYYPYDNINNEFLPISPYNLENLTTVLKLGCLLLGLNILRKKISK